MVSDVGDLDLIPFLWQRASFPIYKQFGVNASELWFLRQVYFACRYRGTATVAKTDLYRELSGNRKRWRKYNGCLFGLLEKKLLGSYEYIPVPGSQAIGLSDLGLSVIRMHNEAFVAISAKYANSGFELVPMRGAYRQTA